MDNKSQPTLITTDEKLLLPDILATPSPVRLTPTGKISHAKTRVYIQRYRKEWEQMPDFKGTLSTRNSRVPLLSLPFGSTRVAREKSTRPADTFLSLYSNLGTVYKCLKSEFFY